MAPASSGRLPKGVDSEPASALLLRPPGILAPSGLRPPLSPLASVLRPVLFCGSLQLRSGSSARFPRPRQAPPAGHGCAATGRQVSGSCSHPGALASRTPFCTLALTKAPPLGSLAPGTSAAPRRPAPGP
eukprot:8987976-Heterocapsa_arctica.AAC.1